MARKERVIYPHSPREAARTFLRNALPSPFSTGESENPIFPSDMDSFADVIASSTKGMESLKDKMEHLVRQSVISVALVVLNKDAGLTPKQERFVLYSSAAKHKAQLEIEIKYYEMFGRLHYNDSGIMQHPLTKESKPKADYVQEKRNMVNNLQVLINDLAQTVGNSPHKER